MCDVILYSGTGKGQRLALGFCDARRSPGGYFFFFSRPRRKLVDRYRADCWASSAQAVCTAQPDLVAASNEKEFPSPYGRTLPSPRSSSLRGFSSGSVALLLPPPGAGKRHPDRRRRPATAPTPTSKWLLVLFLRPLPPRLAVSPIR